MEESLNPPPIEQIPEIKPPRKNYPKKPKKQKNYAYHFPIDAPLPPNSKLTPELAVTVFDGMGSSRSRAIAEFFALNPKVPCSVIAKQFDVSVQRVYQIISKNDFLKSLKRATSHYIRSSMLKAAKTLVNCLESSSDAVKLKASAKILESEGLLKSDAVEVNLNELRDLSIEKLIKIASEPIDPVIVQSNVVDVKPENQKPNDQPQ